MVLYAYAFTIHIRVYRHSLTVHLLGTFFQYTGVDIGYNAMVGTYSWINPANDLCTCLTGGFSRRRFLYTRERGNKPVVPVLGVTT
ncbi:hypothetical protein OS493_025953 [Desmophyllum pertusum]|uniref:Uncharacterized protein n=1 Tax=Desmophyllum pertusum TaxID=174260 RepID=A0A9W9YME8_9CNID|nr:hypothetical protein OS493_025953 [Desmophyllum pertusum]